jgi:TPR repeat protein
MYRLGQGVTMDLSEAAKWIRKAADQGHKGAFSEMGSLYWEGLGVPGNDVLAYMWWEIGATRGDEKSAKLCDMAARKMTPDKIEKAKKMAQDWTPKED